MKENRPLAAYSLQFVIHEMHHTGKNTRVRQVGIVPCRELQIEILSPHVLSPQKPISAQVNDELLYQCQSLRFSVCYKHAY